MDEKILTLVKNCDLSKPMFRARSSEVFDLGDEKVLKLYFDSVSKENVDIELLNTTVAFETGCTPMECFGKVEVNGRQGLVFKKTLRRIPDEHADEKPRDFVYGRENHRRASHSRSFRALR